MRQANCRPATGTRNTGKAVRHAARAVCLTLLLAFFLTALTSCGFSYADADLDRYLTADAEALGRLTLVLPREWEVTDEDIDAAVRELLFSHKSAVNEEREETDMPIGEGDEVVFYYALTARDGTPLSSGHEVGSGDPYLLEIGAGQGDLPGAEKALSRVVPAEYLLTTTGEVPSEGILYLEYLYEEDGTRVRPGGLHRVPVTELDTFFGAGMEAALVGTPLGLQQSVTVTGDFGEGQTTRAYQVLVRCYAADELTFETEEAGVAATARLSLLYMVDYTVPELTAETVTEVIGVCEGEEDPVAALREVVRELLLSEDARVEAVENALWELLSPCFTFVSLPEKAVDTARRALKQDMEDLYDLCRDEYPEESEKAWGEGALDSFGAFLAALYEAPGLTEDEILAREAEAQVREDLVLYYLARYAGYAPDQDAWESGTDAIIAASLGEGESEKALLKHYGGREYFESLYLRDYVLGELTKRLPTVYQ